MNAVFDLNYGDMINYCQVFHIFSLIYHKRLLIKGDLYNMIIPGIIKTRPNKNGEIIAKVSDGDVTRSNLL